VTTMFKWHIEDNEVVLKDAHYPGSYVPLVGFGETLSRTHGDVCKCYESLKMMKNGQLIIGKDYW
jgi:hypothetical protein